MSNGTFLRNAVATGGTQARVQNAIATASARTGVDFGYLFHQAKIESGFNPTAKARTSSATGLYQFIEQSWLATVKKHGSEHGLGWAADAISVGRDGRFRASGPQMRSAILELRKNPDAAAAMAAEYASDNKGYLEKRLGRPVESVDLYMAHFLGPAGARRFLANMDANPDGSAAAILPAAARANRTIFYDRAGQPRSFTEIRQRFAAKFEGAAPAQTIPGGEGDVPERQPLPQLRYASLEDRPLGGRNSLMTPSPQNARLAYLMLASLGA